MIPLFSQALQTGMLYSARYSFEATVIDTPSEATKQIREKEGLASLPIIALTGNVMPGQREKILGAGCNEMLEKPIENFADLFSALDRHVSS